MIASRQIAFGRAVGNKLPDGVVPIEYLESTGTQYIDTGMRKTSGTTIDCTFSLSATNSKAIFGARVSPTAPDRFTLMAIGSYFRFDAYRQPTFGTPDTTSMFRFQYDGQNAFLTNLTTGTTSTSSTKTGDAGVLDISLFGVNNNGVVGALMEGRMYAFKICTNSALVRDFIPVRVGNVGYMYDRVSGQLFGNAGEGAFVLGADLIDYTAKDYVHFNDYAFLYDGIENVGLGKHADALPIEYGKSQWRNIAPLAKTFEYNTDLDVVKMTPTKNSMLFSTGDAWAAWGNNFNSKKINNDQAKAFLAKIFSVDSEAATIINPTEYTAELIFSKNDNSDISEMTHILSGYNQRALYYVWSTTGRPFWRYGFVDNSVATPKERLTPITGLMNKGTYHIVFSQSSKNSTNKLYINGIQVYEKAEKATIFFYNMVSLKRADTVTVGETSGEFFGLRISPVVFSDEEIAYNYNIDKARFGL